MSTNLKLTLAEYDELIKQGHFDGPQRRRVELIFGELREMSPIGSVHEELVDLLTRWSFRNVNDEEVRVRIQNSLGFPELESAPEPDLAWVKARSYRDARPHASDVLLVIEVADSSLRYDQGKKAKLYAQVGVRDYWVINIPKSCVDVYRDPRGETFRETTRYGKAETISPREFPSITLAVDDLFPS